ncbi:MAG: galactose-1-phosphate uridylyltransferase [candidate division Zixibacteria bacterium]|nr:galactose-1-phosphate uridylyltransferase [candidate division Zixibacteria bacterium]
MPQLRKDAVTGRWVIISKNRRRRPNSFESVPKRGPARLCPFCPGHEDSTPPEILAYRKSGTEPNQPGWSLRVFPNKYPALEVEGDLVREPHGLYDMMQGVGAHEVIVETPDHSSDMAQMDENAIRNVLWVYRERMMDLERDRRLKYILVFKNHGSAAGASLEHSHSQLIATPIIPKKVLEEIKGSREYFEFKERCVFCDIVRQELVDKERIVNDYDSFIAIEPFAARFPFETWILPKTHQSSYLEMSEADFTVLAHAFKDILTRLKIALNDAPFNFVLHTRPVSKEHHEYYHWHFEIMPKLTKVAGFEWGSGFYINPTSPEEAAAYLRDIDVDINSQSDSKMTKKENRK